MNNEGYRNNDNAQAEYYIHQVKKQLLREQGLKEEGTVYGIRNSIYSKKMQFYQEIWNMYRAGARITIAGRDLDTTEFSAAAELLAEDNFKRTIIPGEYAHCTEYRLTKKTLH